MTPIRRQRIAFEFPCTRAWDTEHERFFAVTPLHEFALTSILTVNK